MPEISIIVPVYNVEKYLHRCVDSILAQSFTDFELILVDDGSPDNCGKICDEYAKKDNRIVVIHKENGGLSDARNAGLQIVKGDYICFVDSDDWIGENMISELYSAIKNNGADIATCTFYYAYDNEKEISLNEYILPTESGSTICYERDEYLGSFARYALYILIISCNKLYSAKVFQNLRFEVGRTCEDEIIYHQILNNSQKIAVVNKPLYYYFQSRDSITRGNTSWKNAANLLIAYKERRDFFSNTKYVNSFYKCESEYITYLISHWNLLKKINKVQAKTESAYLKSIMKSVLHNPLLSLKTKAIVLLFSIFPDFCSFLFNLLQKS